MRPAQLTPDACPAPWRQQQQRSTWNRGVKAPPSSFEVAAVAQEGSHRGGGVRPPVLPSACPPPTSVIATCRADAGRRSSGGVRYGPDMRWGRSRHAVVAVGGRVGLGLMRWGRSRPDSAVWGESSGPDLMQHICSFPTLAWACYSLVLRRAGFSQPWTWFLPHPLHWGWAYSSPLPAGKGERAWGSVPAHSHLLFLTGI